MELEWEDSIWWAYFHRHKDEIQRDIDVEKEYNVIKIDIRDLIEHLPRKSRDQLMRKIGLSPVSYLKDLSTYFKNNLFALWMYSNKLDKTYPYHEIMKKFGSKKRADVLWLEDPNNNPSVEYLKEVASKEKIECVDIEEYIYNVKIRVSISNLPDNHYKYLNEINVHNMPGIITVEGIVRGISQVYERTTVACFECGRCSHIWNLKVGDELYNEPYGCDKDNGGCGKVGPACNWIRHTDRDVTTNYQLMSLQESPSNTGGSGQPVIKKVILEGPVVEVGDNAIGPGDEVKLIVTPKKVHKKFQGQKSFLNEIWLNCISIEKNESKVQIDISEEDIIEFHKIKDYALDELIQILSLEVQGENEILYGLALHLTGGVGKILTSGHIVRGPVHILLIGDPGVAKSHLLHVLESLIPKSVFVSGKGASEKGIIAAAIKDQESEGGYNLEAGAMVLADRSSVLVDEVDKMDDGVSDAMLEPMESQAFTVHKGPFHLKLNTRCGVVAVGNPKHGKFRPDEIGAPLISCVDQKKMPPPWMERIDISYPMYDIPDEKRDGDLFDAIIGNLNPHLEEYQTMDKNEKEAKWERIRKYAWYARNEIKPKFYDIDLLKWLKSEYLKLRKSIKSPGQSSIDDTLDMESGITRRHIITLQRLSEARSKWFLREEIIKEDCEIAIHLLKLSLQMTTGGDLLMYQDGFTREERSTFEIVYDAINSYVDDERIGAMKSQVIEHLEQQNEMEEEEIKIWFKKLVYLGYAEFVDQTHIKTIRR